ncbi:MAG: hypothetical protein Kow0040_07670 [Thermogutta sp.]
MALPDFKILPARLMPIGAVLQFELQTLLKSWLVRLWLVAAALLALLTVMVGWAVLPDAILISVLLAAFLVFPWFLVIIVLGVNASTAGRLDAAADGILSRPIKRWEFLTGIWAARLLMVWAVSLAVLVPAVIAVVAGDRPQVVETQPITAFGLAAALAVVLVVLAFLVTVGVLLGTLFKNAWLAMVVLLFVWYPINAILMTFRLAEFSPISLDQAMPSILRKDWSPPEDFEVQATGPLQAEMQRQAEEFIRSLTGTARPEPRNREPGFYRDAHKYEDLSVAKVILSYGGFTILLWGLTMLIFYFRDL